MLKYIKNLLNSAPYLRGIRQADWDFGDGFSIPSILIPEAEHKKGKNPVVEQDRQPSGFVFPYELRENGDILIGRTNDSVLPYRDLNIRIFRNRRERRKIYDRNNQWVEMIQVL